MATTLRNDAKNQIIKLLRKQGYPTYARLVDYFDIYLSDDPDVIGYMIPGKAKIVLNKELSIDQVSTIIRHEILHEYLTHGPRQEKFSKAHPELNVDLAPHDLSNIAADFEISNKGYTELDKTTVSGIKLGNRVLKGLVTELEHPDWVDLSYEEMYQKLLEENKEERKELKQLLDRMQGLSKQDLDDLEQDAESIPDDSDSENNTNSSKDTDSSDTKDDKEVAKDAVKKLKKDVAKAEQDSEKSEEVFDTPEEQAAKADIAARAQAIRDFIENSKNKQDISDENATAIRREKAAKAAKEVERYQGRGLSQFKLNLNRFISDQIGELEDDSYSRIHPSYEDSEFIMPGKIVREEKNIPLINVYHDVSGSFSDPAKTAAALKAIESLNQYVRDGDIEIKLYYFADEVSDNIRRAGGGTRGTPIQNHIEATKPTNVIIITDADINDCTRVTTVPGAVWMLFYDSRSKNVMDHIKGKRQNKYYDIAY